MHAFVTAELDRLLSQRRTWRARRLNAAGLACGTLLVDTYQTLKAHEHAIDFTDLEWHALRLLADPEHAAYMQARLDARYRHILLDEFQDTNALQWQVLQSWLAAYGPSDGGRARNRSSDRCSSSVTRSSRSTGFAAPSPVSSTPPSSCCSATLRRITCAPMSPGAMRP